MNTIRILLASAFVAMLGNPLLSQAQDIDLYSSAASVTGTDLPNVMFILDNAAGFEAESHSSCTYKDTGGSPNMGTKAGGIEQCALVNAINGLPDDTVNIGIMVYNISGTFSGYSCNGGAGGCLVQPLIKMTAANKANLVSTIKGWTLASIKGNNEATTQAVQETWAYYAGKTGMSGRTYSSPALTGCQKNYSIFIGNAVGSNGKPGDAGANPGVKLTTTVDANTALSAAQKTLLKTNIQIPSGAYGSSAYTCSPNPYTLNLSNGHGDNTGLYADEWSRYMYTVDLSTSAMPANRKIHTYTIGVLGSSCKADYPALLTSMALKGGGKYFPTASSADITQSILRILNEVQAVNSVFSSASLPVSVNTQGTYLNQIFMGMFRPDAGGTPRWKGNLKQYQFTYNATAKQLTLADATGAAVISAAGTGFLSPNAISFWTCSSATNPANTTTCSSSTPYTDVAKGFWQNNPNGIGDAWDLPDGEVVEKGGAAQILRLANLSNTYTATPGTASNPRNLYTYLTGTDLRVAANVFDTSNAAITDAMLGTGSISISSITSAPTVLASSFTPGVSGTPLTITITGFAKGLGSASATITATVASTTSLTPGTTQIAVTTTKSKYNCTACTVASVVDATHFTYIASNGAQAAPATPYVANILSNFITVSSTAHGLAVGQTMTISSCTTHTALNTTDATVSSVTNANTFVISTTVVLASTAVDTACQYSPKTASVTTSAAHNIPTGALVSITGAAPTGYNGSWIATATGSSTFTYQYTAAARLASFAGAGATVSSTGTTRDALTKWVRGEDNYGDEASLCPPGSTAGTPPCPNPAINIRPSVHGDVLHSRPLVLNYGGTKGVIVFYGSNDGVFRAVNGNQTNPASSTLPTPGSELWGFIPSEFIGQLKRQHDNSPALLLPSTSAGIIPTPQTKDYFVDGSTGVYQIIDGAGVTTKAYLYLGMRRGGRFLYALKVTDPINPKFKWKIHNTDTGFSELGQTWSQPKVANVKGYSNPVLIFGAGYDAPAEDTEPPTADTMGRGIFIVDALDGSLVWKATYGASLLCPSALAACTLPEMKYSIPSDITLLDKNNDGNIDRLYVGDVGGNVWRVDLEPTAGNTPAFWQVEKLAALGCATGPCPDGPPRTTPRKIFYPPEVISTSGYDAVFTATGDREHPLYSTTAQSACSVTNRAYLLKDTAIGLDGSAITPITELTGTTANLFDSTSTPWDGTLNGYYVSFNTCEKSVNAPLVTAGYIYFGTNQAKAPNNHRCEESLGEAIGYKLKPFAGTYAAGEFEGGGLPPSPVSGVVNIVDSSGKTIQVPFCIGCGGEEDDGGNSGCGSESALAGCRPPINVSTSRSRSYWYIKDK